MSDENPIVRVTVTEFDENAIQAVQWAIDRCQQTGQWFLPLQIFSPGGDLFSLFGLIDVIEASPIPVATIAIGTAQSAGSALLASGHPGLRFVAPNATVMVHQASAKLPFQSIPDIEQDIRVFKTMNDRFLGQLDRCSGKAKGFWRRKLRDLEHRDLTLSALQSVRAGLADHVGLPVIGVEETRQVTLNLPEKKKAKARKR
jgi:ATP-dependent protease ClpP protease subunit